MGKLTLSVRILYNESVTAMLIVIMDKPSKRQPVTLESLAQTMAAGFQLWIRKLTPSLGFWTRKLTPSLGFWIKRLTR